MLSKISTASTETLRRLAAIEEKNVLLNEFYLLRDDILNFVTVCGLIAVKAVKAGEMNEMWRQGAEDRCS